MKTLMLILTFFLISGCNTYTGERQDGNPHWKGTWKRGPALEYVGEFMDDSAHGQGTLNAGFGSDKRTIVGEFKKDPKGQFLIMPDGQATMTVANGERFVGEFRKGVKYKGIYTWPNGDKYSGEYKDDLFRNLYHGQGTFTFADGRVQLGQWKDGKPHGRLIEYNADKSIERAGIFEDGKFIRAENINPAIFTRISPVQLSQPSQPLEQATTSTTELEKLRAEAEEAKRKKAELEEQLHLAQQQARPMSALTSSPMTNMANRRALVIGNDTYKSVAKLLNAREDARTMASNLTSVGYQVTLKLDLNEKEMKAALRTFANQVQGGDEVLFFFAGHGVQLGSTNYLLPTDIVGGSEAQVRDEAIQLQRVLDDMAGKKAKFTLAMIDACRDNPFKSSGRAIGGRGLAPTTAATGQMVIFSAGTGQQALDKLSDFDKNKNSLFTRVFVEEMQKSSESIDRVVKNVRNRVADIAKSFGHEQVPAIYDQVLGDFYFKK